MIAKTSWGAESVFFVSLLGKVGKVGRSWMFHQVKRKKLQLLLDERHGFSRANKGLEAAVCDGS